MIHGQVLIFYSLAQAGIVPNIPIGWVAPFVAMLAAIAIMPFVHKHWWEKNYPFVAAGLAALASWPYLSGHAPIGRWVEGMTDYVSFIILLGSLYVISGGIVIKVQRKATPLMNCTLLLMGAVLANLLGTTGASMLLIRPYLRMNRTHLRPYHIVFFIFLISNVGGSLTPVGDPPLFLGYLMGVPFWWVLDHMRWIWGTAVGALLVIFFVIDTFDHRKEARHHEHDGGATVQIVGIHNILLVLAVVAAVFQQGFFDVIDQIHHGAHGMVMVWQLITSREVIMLAAAAISRIVTGKSIYQTNEFSIGPIREVAILFIGIFATMVPATQYMQANAARIPLRTPAHFYFTSGVLSSVLDNAPTYKTLLETRLGEVDPGQIEQARGWLDRMADARNKQIPTEVPQGTVRQALEAIVRYHPDDAAEGKVSDEQLQVAFQIGVPDWNWFVIAISAGSVFWGACTYIGNGPNFMVKSIADASGAVTPGFGEYIWKYTLPVLIPVYLLIWLIFFR
ncbi:MAG TPA: sodium:proton antiporter [Tepidisphaeraceae bacterium]|jgi:Na+/H+ antiporter NhaD/arsenite permease-like protein|nr:sodium:proton antiporter [Tepidisphaeraceae bacterium]